MFKKILIANRGEIACRIMRTARRMGIATVAVYSDADAGTPHVMMADEAVHIGGAASADSYLRGERIIAAAKETGAEAIHPGFGFLSENAGFVAEVEAAGLVFIGPGTKAIAVMGDKIESKALAKSAGVSTVPGTEGEVDDVEVGLKAAAEIGYPVMVKASAGGGGKGMRVIESADDLPDGMRAAMSEAQTAFGDSRVFIEKFVVQPRHIWPTSTATSSMSASANARSSAATRRWSRRRRAPLSRRRRAPPWASRRSSWRVPLVTALPARSNSSSVPTRISISSR